MSRSFKKSPICNDGHVKSTKTSKRFANKKIRNYKNKIQNGKSYKKISESYDIHDYYLRETWEEAKHNYETEDWYQYYYPTLLDFYKRWLKYYKRK